ncbi:MAG: AI-2E family transporter [Candidatus Margulisbacteria bacterium]|nr:AI-2E family transporter [Candidatus Margulisiibacteriota bacterium]
MECKNSAAFSIGMNYFRIGGGEGQGGAGAGPLAVYPSRQYNKLAFMPHEKEKIVAYRRTVAIIAVVIGLILAFMIVRPFLVAIISAAVLAYLFYPTYKRIAKAVPGFLPKETVAAMLTCLLIILIVLVPLVIVSAFLAKEVREGYIFIQQLVTAPDFKLQLPPWLAQQIGSIDEFKQPAVELARQSVGWLQDVITGIPNVILNIFVTIFSVYFFLKGAKGIHKFIEEFFPLPEGRYRQIFSRFDELSRSMVMGQIVVGLIQGFLAWIGFFVLGVPNPVLWGFLTAIISIIPMLGAALVWFPIAVYLFITGQMVGIYWKAFSLLIYGTLVISTIDNILKPKIIGDRAKIHPLIILFGILGGIQLIGIPGILIGPMILTLFDVVLEMFREVV